MVYVAKGATGAEAVQQVMQQVIGRARDLFFDGEFVLEHDGALSIGDRAEFWSIDGGERVEAYFVGMATHCGLPSLRLAYGEVNGDPKQRFSIRYMPVDQLVTDSTGAEGALLSDIVAPDLPDDPSPTLRDWHGDIVTPITAYSGHGLHVLRQDDDNVQIETVGSDHGGWVWMSRGDLVAFARELIAEFEAK